MCSRKDEIGSRSSQIIRLRFSSTHAPPAAPEHLFGIGTGKGVAGDLFLRLPRYPAETNIWPLRQTQVRADGRQQIRRKHVVHGDQVPLLGQLLKFPNYSWIISPLSNAHSRPENIATVPPKWLPRNFGADLFVCFLRFFLLTIGAPSTICRTSRHNYERRATRTPQGTSYLLVLKIVARAPATAMPSRNGCNKSPRISSRFIKVRCIPRLIVWKIAAGCRPSGKNRKPAAKPSSIPSPRKPEAVARRSAQLGASLLGRGAGSERAGGGGLAMLHWLRPASLQIPRGVSTPS